MSLPTVVERDLVERMLAGEERAFEEFFEGYFPRVYRFALTRVGDRGDAVEEITQATLCRAVDRLETFRGEAPLFTWLCTICRHEIGRYFSRRGMAQRKLELPEDSEEARAALDSLARVLDEGPAVEVQRKEIARLVQVTLDNLPSRYASVLEWKYLQDLPVKEIAERLQVGLKAAESLLVRARAAFRDGFSALTGEGLRFDASDGGSGRTGAP